MNLYINSSELILMQKIMIFQLKLVKYTIALLNQLKYQPRKVVGIILILHFSYAKHYETC